MKLFLASATLLLLSACAASTQGGAERRVTYACEGGPSLTVVYGRGTASIVSPGGERIVLPQKPTGSSFLYETPMHSIRGKGREITYTIGRRVPMLCRAPRGMAR